MTRVIIIVIISTLSFNSRADYDPLQLYEMIIKAEKIIYGTIISLDSNTFTLQIDGSLTSDSGTIKINKFEDWACASRWTEYQIGQRLLIFLTTWNGNLVSMSGGNEGELPIINNKVFIHGFSISIPPPPPPKGLKLKEELYFDVDTYEVYGSTYYGKEWDFQDFINDAEYIRNCFEFEYGPYYEPINWKTNCRLDEVQNKAAQSKLVDWVFRESGNGKNER